MLVTKTEEERKMAAQWVSSLICRSSIIPKKAYLIIILAAYSVVFVMSGTQWGTLTGRVWMNECIWNQKVMESAVTLSPFCWCLLQDGCTEVAPEVRSWNIALPFANFKHLDSHLKLDPFSFFVLLETGGIHTWANILLPVPQFMYYSLNQMFLNFN